MKAWFLLLSLCVTGSAHAINTLSDLQNELSHKNYSAAIKIGEALKALNPNSPSVLFYTALAYQNNKQFDQAKKLYLSAITRNTRLPAVYNNLAMIYVQQKNYDKAAETLTHAINSQQNIATAYANLSEIYRYMAGQAYQQVLDDGARQKLPKTKIKQRLLVSVDLHENIITALPKPIIKVKEPIKVAAVTKPIALKATKKPVKAKDTEQRPAAKQAILDWANAWQNKQYQNYINSYSSNYAPKKLTHKAWLAQRNNRLSRPGEIAVDVSNFDITFGNNKAYVNFDQRYQSKTYKDKVRKRVHLTLINKQWLITSEVTLSVL